jgi:ectoine hydroxylase-related dioxygenase (phytanoyl-CoA dioxygenase family)
MQAITRHISDDEIAVYERDGVVLLKGMLSLQFVNGLRSTIDQAIATAASSASAYNLSRIITAIKDDKIDDLSDLREGQYDIQALAKMVQASGNVTVREEMAKTANGSYYIDSGVAARLTALRKIVLNENMGYIAGTIMRSNEIRFFDDQIFVKEANCPDKTAFHQDSTYFHAEGSQTCVMWVPVDPVRDEHGPMRYIRGSHKWNRNFKPNVFVSTLPFPGAEGEMVPDIDGHEEDYDLIQFDVDPGDIIIHHYKTVHGAGANHSRYQVRRAASLRYIGDDMTYIHRPYAPPQSHHIHQLKHGDSLTAPCFPLTWSKRALQYAA